ncbi:aldo/keto reductase [Streptomyces hoynatensis]|uniref:Aldo/keto reductase n=1 Tax=Streptomyces hoynatensis TaxID=1141874 RepID=A0A3A9Z615_9ACTN|nr:aldo/keto reductase [Streptomyces hoynatensis]RKN43922.1 aldo/keto reductase [Streptomyces hoynatensis]
MRVRRRGRGPELTELGFGAAQLGNLYRATTDEEAAGAVAAAWEAGLRYFDTAPHYGLGLSERRLGAALAGRPRAEFTVSTKVGRLLVPSPGTSHLPDEGGFEVPAAHRRTWDFSRDGILRSLEGSLERLGLDRVDIAYLHDPDDHWEEASTSGINTLIELREQGVVGAIGAGMNQSEMLAEFVRRCDIDLVMLAGRYTLLEQGALEELLPLALERGVGVVAAGVYNSGLLSAPRPAADATYNYQPASAGLIRRAHALADHCERHGVTLPAAAVAYPLRHPAVVSVVLGTRDAGQLKANVARYHTPIPEELWEELAAAGLIPAPSATPAPPAPAASTAPPAAPAADSTRERRGTLP